MKIKLSKRLLFLEFAMNDKLKKEEANLGLPFSTSIYSENK